MDVDVLGRPPDGATLVVGVAEPHEPLPDGAAGLADLIASHQAPSKRNKAQLVQLGDRRVVAAGLGSRDAIEPDALRDAAAAAVRELRATVGGHAAWLLDASLSLDPGEQTRAVVDGAVLGGYDPGAWKTGPATTQPVERLTIVGPDDVANAASRAATVAAWTNHARDLANAPPNELNPIALADRAAELASRFDSLSFTALGPAEMQKLGMGALLGVSSASHNEPRMIVLRHEPGDAADADFVLGLVGKGLTFDSGGIALKPPTYMENMRADMAGAAAVIAATGAIAELGVPLRTLTVVPAVENVMGGGGYRPGDILTASDGKTIEITNTDAEGRLVLADALVYARQQGATHIVDLATLTGIMSAAMGDVYGGVFSDDADWRGQVVAAGDASGDLAWPWPLHRRFRRLIDSDFADLKNSEVSRRGVPIYAAEFLREFAGEGAWAHMDIAGAAFFTFTRGDYLSQRGGTGYGVRLLAELASRLAAE
jgi:leucyl aminopeptidase